MWNPPPSDDGAAPSMRARQASPVGTIAAVSIMRITAFSGARVRWTTRFGTTKPCCGESVTERPSRSMMKTTAEHEKEFVVVIVLMPMILALHDAEAYNGIVHLAERLIIPLVGAGLHE